MKLKKYHPFNTVFVSIKFAKTMKGKHSFHLKKKLKKAYAFDNNLPNIHFKKKTFGKKTICSNFLFCSNYKKVR